MGGCTARALQVHDHPAGPVGHPGDLPVMDPPLSSQTAVQTAISVKTVIFYIKLVKTVECHQKVSKRPVIVPISKTGLESQLLIFWDFPFL